MPTYQYACTDCGEQLEVVQKFTDDALTICPACDGRLRKVFSAVGVVFKGSGFYRTDSRAAASGSSNGSSNGSSDGSSNGSAKTSSNGAAESSAGSSSTGSSTNGSATNGSAKKESPATV